MSFNTLISGDYETEGTPPAALTCLRFSSFRSRWVTGPLVFSLAIPSPLIRFTLPLPSSSGGFCASSFGSIVLASVIFPLWLSVFLAFIFEMWTNKSSEQCCGNKSSTVREFFDSSLFFYIFKEKKEWIQFVQNGCVLLKLESRYTVQLT